MALVAPVAPVALVALVTGAAFASQATAKACSRGKVKMGQFGFGALLQGFSSDLASAVFDVAWMWPWTFQDDPGFVVDIFTHTCLSSRDFMW